MNDGLDILGPALISLTGNADQLRMHRFLAHVNRKPTKTGVSFIWEGAWEYHPMSGSGRVPLGKDGRLKGLFRIEDGSFPLSFLRRRISERGLMLRISRA